MPTIEKVRTTDERRLDAANPVVCLLCGGGAEEASEAREPMSEVCPNCEETADLPLSHYYLMQYYRCIAD